MEKIKEYLKNLIELVNSTGMPSWLVITFCVLLIIIIFFLCYGFKKILNISSKPESLIKTKNNHSVKGVKLSLVDFCIQSLKKFKFNNSKEVTVVIVKRELIKFYGEYAQETISVDSVPKLGETVFRKLKERYK